MDAAYLTSKFTQIEARMKTLRSYRKAELLEMVKRNYRVCDLRDADKGTLVGMMLEAEFGRRVLEAFDARPRKGVK